MNTSYTLDSEGKITELLINGKPAKPMYMRGLRKAQTANYFLLIASPSNVATNPFSGVSVELNGFEASIYNFLLNWYEGYIVGREKLPIQVYDDMKYLLLEINPDAYYDLID